MNSQITHLDSIAFVCPLLGGNAVFQARSLQATYNDTLDYDDKLICNQQGVYYKLAQKDSVLSIEEVLNLFPNPTEDVLNIFLQSEIKDNYTVEIFNVLGQKVFEKNKCSNNVLISMNSIALSKGNYILVLKQLHTGNVFRGRFHFTNK